MSDTKRYLMACGHAANATHGDNREPACAICGCFDVAKTIESDTEGLENRIARCSYGAHKDVPSKWTLPFFEYRPDKEFDSYYCGCWGWD